MIRNIAREKGTVSTLFELKWPAMSPSTLPLGHELEAEWLGILSTSKDKKGAFDSFLAQGHFPASHRMAVSLESLDLLGIVSLSNDK